MYNRYRIKLIEWMAPFDELDINLNRLEAITNDKEIIGLLDSLKDDIKTIKKNMSYATNKLISFIDDLKEFVNERNY